MKADREHVIRAWASFKGIAKKKATIDCESMLPLVDQTMELLKEQEHKDKMFHALEEDWKRLKALLKEQEHKDRMFHALEEDWKRLKAMLKEQEEIIQRTLLEKTDKLNCLTSEMQIDLQSQEIRKVLEQKK